MDRAYSVLSIKSTSDDERLIEGIASTPSPDRVGDIVDPMGAVFALPMPLLWQHNHDEPIGHVEFAKPTKDGIPFKARIASIAEPGRLKERLDEAWQSIKAGLVRAVSIGFSPLEYSLLKDGGLHFTKWEWLELSAVTIPANAEASITSIKSIDRELRGASAPEPRRVEARGASAASVKLNSQEATVPKTIAEQISALEATRAAKAARMSTVMQKSIDDGRSTDTAEQEEFDTLETELAQIDGDLRRLKSLGKANAASAKPVGDVTGAQGGSDARGGLPAVKHTEQVDKGIEFARFAICLASAKGNIPQALEIAKNRYKNSDGLILSLKAAVEAGTTTDATWAAPLVDSYQRFAGDFIEFLRPQTILGRFGQNGIPSLRRVPFNISIAGQTSGGAGYWVGEGAPKPLTKFDFNETTLRWAKVANIAVVTEELLRFSNPAAEALVRDALAEALIARLDTDFVDPAKAAVANVSPASITNGVTAIVGTAVVEDDVQAVFAPYIAANLTPSAGVWIMSTTLALKLSLLRDGVGNRVYPDISMTGGRFIGLPVIVSDYVAADLVILVNASDVYLADDGQVMIDASREASLQMDSAPTNNSDTPTATTLVSMFQTNSVAIRAERYINWAKRRATAAQIITGVTWGA